RFGLPYQQVHLFCKRGLQMWSADRRRTSSLFLPSSPSIRISITPPMAYEALDFLVGLLLVRAIDYTLSKQTGEF
ncbi:hypothetical protein R6Q57_026116, partial [Mikania cordata]